MIALLLLACRPVSVDTLLPESPGPAPTTVEAYDWLEGHWASDGASETWVATDGMLVGVGLIDGFYEVLRIDADAGVGYTAWPAGSEGVRFPAHGAPDGTAVFLLREHDWPQLIRYDRADGRVDVTLAGDGPTKRYSLASASRTGVAALEDADRGMGRRPLASGASPDGQLGFTIGRDDAGSYAAVRTRTADGAWLSTFERHWAVDRPPEGDLASWVSKVHAAFLRDFAVPATTEGELESVVEVVVDASGAVSEWRLVKSSGHVDFDEAVKQAVSAVSKVPRPPEDAVGRPLVIRYVFP